MNIEKVLTIELNPGEIAMTASELSGVLTWCASHWTGCIVQGAPTDTLRVYQVVKR